MHGAFDRRVSAHEQQLKPPIRDRVEVDVTNIRRRVPLGVEREDPLSLRAPEELAPKIVEADRSASSRP